MTAYAVETLIGLALISVAVGTPVGVAVYYLTRRHAR